MTVFETVGFTLVMLAACIGCAAMLACAFYGAKTLHAEWKRGRDRKAADEKVGREFAETIKEGGR